jgi:hypothetical protein
MVNDKREYTTFHYIFFKGKKEIQLRSFLSKDKEKETCRDFKSKYDFYKVSYYLFANLSGPNFLTWNQSLGLMPLT